MNREEGSPPFYSLARFSPPLLRGNKGGPRVSASHCGGNEGKNTVGYCASPGQPKNFSTTEICPKTLPLSSFCSCSAHLVRVETEFWPQQFLSSVLLDYFSSFIFETIESRITSFRGSKAFVSWRESKLKWNASLSDNRSSPNLLNLFMGIEIDLHYNSTFQQTIEYYQRGKGRQRYI